MSETDKKAIELLRALVIISGTGYYGLDDARHLELEVPVGLLKRARRLIAAYDEREPEC